MAGLAATFGPVPPPTSPDPLRALADALAARGPDAASWRAGDLRLMIRAALPAVAEFRGGALVADGIVGARHLAARYAELGRSALTAGPEPYAVILADRSRDALLLARGATGPPLYWARRGATVLAASEPAALLAAGVPAEPDPAVVDRFIATGACDETAHTFFAGVRRVLPGQVVELRRDHTAGTVTIHTTRAARERAVTGAAGARRIGVRLGHGPAGSEVLAEVLAGADRTGPLPVFSPTFPGLSAAPDHAGVLRALPYGVVRHRALPFFADEIDVDAYLLDLGEPTPDLEDVLLWQTARAVAGEVDVLLDPARHGGHLDRLADRLASRYGVAVRYPLRHPAGAEPAPAGPLPAGPPVGPPPEALLREVLLRLRAELVTAYLHPRLPGRRNAQAELLALINGRRDDPAAVWRRYLVEHWLRCVVAPAAAEVEVAGPSAGPTPSERPGRTPGWTCLPVRTEAFAAGDKIPEKLAWYVGEAVAAGPHLGEPWYVLVAAAPVAVMQGLARPLWEIRPQWTARLAHRLAGRRTGLASLWAAQVAAEQAGRGRLLVASAGAALGRVDWYRRLVGPAVCAIRGPREGAPPPGHVAVTPSPTDPDRVAAEIVTALRTAVPDPVYASFGGCAVIGGGCLLGWAGDGPPLPAEGSPLAIAGPGRPASEPTPLVIAFRDGAPG